MISGQIWQANNKNATLTSDKYSVMLTRMSTLSTKCQNIDVLQRQMYSEP